jgi:hypothetical protein
MFNIWKKKYNNLVKDCTTPCRNAKLEPKQDAKATILPEKRFGVWREKCVHLKTVKGYKTEFGKVIDASFCELAVKCKNYKTKENLTEIKMGEMI